MAFAKEGCKWGVGEIIITTGASYLLSLRGCKITSFVEDGI